MRRLLALVAALGVVAGGFLMGTASAQAATGTLGAANPSYSGFDWTCTVNPGGATLDVVGRSWNDPTVTGTKFVDTAKQRISGTTDQTLTFHRDSDPNIGYAYRCLWYDTSGALVGKTSNYLTTATTMLIGARYKSGTTTQSADYATADAAIGPLHETRVFQGTLPSTRAQVTPDGDVDIVSYKNHGTTANFTSYLQSLRPQDRLVFYHEPEGPNDWTSGAAFVAAYVAEYDLAKSIRPDIRFGMISGGFQWRDGNRGADGSFLPPADKVDFYAFDSYRDGSTDASVNPNGYGAIVPLQQVSEFQNWLGFVQSRGKPLLVTEYGRGVEGAGYTWAPAQRANVIPQDAAYLKSLGFQNWMLWWCDLGPDGRSWKFSDQASIDAWRAVASSND